MRNKSLTIADIFGKPETTEVEPGVFRHTWGTSANTSPLADIRAAADACRLRFMATENERTAQAIGRLEKRLECDAAELVRRGYAVGVLRGGQAFAILDPNGLPVEFI